MQKVHGLQITFHFSDFFHKRKFFLMGLSLFTLDVKKKKIASICRKCSFDALSVQGRTLPARRVSLDVLYNS